ncbi:glutamine synthetase [Apiospora rasikravindrae]|uniref:Glutamine synthetase n=1 Tax=Apiospora rasikravindrae TaxID=990691 RepID=A0ABR1RMJ0_9PEZI
MAEKQSHDEILNRLRSLDAKWLRIYWVDATASSKCRLIPVKRVRKALESGKSLSISIFQGALGMLPCDMLAPGVTATHTYNLHPDWSSLRRGPVEGHASCYGEFRQIDGSDCVLCPRRLLRKTVEQAAASGLDFLIGFEIEFVALEKVPRREEAAAAEDGPKYRAIAHDGHAWSTSRTLAAWGRQNSIVTVLDEMVDLLDAADIPVEQLHAESTPGQFEIVLPPLPPLQACDALLHARQIIESTAARHGFRVTLHPKPSPGFPGTAAHAHMSVVKSSSRSEASSPQEEVEAEVYEGFYAGILSHLPAIAAFTYANPASYERAIDSSWAGGRWVTWGTQNRETPLRKCEGSHWEFKALDGLANPFVAVAALLAAGVDGDCEPDPASLGAEQRAALGITRELPRDLDQALEFLAADSTLEELVGREFVRRYVDVKRAELAFLMPMADDERRQWLVERY